MTRLPLLAALLPALALAASAQTWTALLKTVPGVPGTPAEAAKRYQARAADPGAPLVDEHWRDAKAARFGDELLQRSQAASAQPGGMPSAGNAQAMASQMQGMSQQQQMAYAMQMMQQMNGAAAGPMTELTAADQALIAQYTVRSENQVAEYQRASTHASELGAKLEAWGAEHEALRADYQRRVEALDYCTQDAAIRKLVAEHRGAQQDLATRHLGQANSLMQPQDRAINEIAGFLDSHRPRPAAAQDPRVTGPVNSYVQHAVQVFGLWFGEREQLHRYGASWVTPGDVQPNGGAC